MICPGAEDLAAWLDGRLSPAERARVEIHLASCEDCREVTAEMVRQTTEPGTRQELRRTRSRFWRISGGVFAAAAALFLVVRLWPTPADQQVNALVRAVGANRAFEPRLSGGFAYGPVQPPTRSAEPSDASPDLRIAAAQIEKQLQSARTAATLRAFGAAQLLLGHVDPAVDALSEAARLDAGDAATQNDLAAAYLVRGHRNDRSDDFPRALDAAERALRAAPSDEARFNRALALEALGLRDQAREAWRDYLAQDADSPWSADAQRHLAALDQQGRRWDAARQRLLAALAARDRNGIASVARAFPAPAREYLEDTLLPNLARARRQQKTRWPTLLGEAQMLARAIDAQTGDTYCTDLLAPLESARGPDPDGLAGIESYGRARAFYKANRFLDAAREFTLAHDRLRRLASPLIEQTNFYRAVMAYRDGRLIDAAAEATDLSVRAQHSHYGALEARAHWLLGLMDFAAGRYTEALDEYSLTLEKFSGMGDAQNVANAHDLRAEVFDALGQSEQAWRERVAGLRGLDGDADPRRRNAMLLAAAFASEQQDAPLAALAFEQAAIASARRSGILSNLAEAHIYRAATRRALGQSEAALKDAATTRQLAGQVGDAWIADRLSAEADEVEGQVFSSMKDPRAVSVLSGALAYFDRTGSISRTEELYLARGRAERAAGDMQAAERDFARGIESFEHARRGVASEELRISYFAESWDLFAEMIGLELERGDSNAAFAYAERSRARALLDAWQDRRPMTSPADVAAAIRPKTTLACFERYGSRLAIWLIRRDRTAFLDVTLPPSFDEVVRSFSDDPSDAQAGATLYDVLWKPIAGKVPVSDRIVVVPARELQHIAYAALRDRRTGRYLVEDHEIVVAPSATLFVSASGRLAHVRPPRSLLVAGNPDVKRADLPSLRRLPDAAAEIAEVSRLYPTTTALVGAAATRDAFLDALGDHDVVHFAGHALVNRRYPFRSRLVMSAAGSKDAADVFASDIGGRRLEHAQLVVLAACGSADGPASRGEGVLSLARPFLAAGVPVVVAALHDVDDRVSRELMRRFHNGYARHGDAPRALRDAQLALLRSGDAHLTGAGAWGAFVTIGGVQPREGK